MIPPDAKPLRGVPVINHFLPLALCDFCVGWPSQTLFGADIENHPQTGFEGASRAWKGRSIKSGSVRIRCRRQAKKLDRILDAAGICNYHTGP